MNENAISTLAGLQADLPIPADDLRRKLTVARADQGEHLGVVGDTYTILISGKDTAGSYCLIDMQVPPGGGPPHHRHDFEESFTVLEGEIEATFRGDKLTVRAGETIHIPSNAPHFFVNAGTKPARLLCICSPADWTKCSGKSGFGWRPGPRRRPSRTKRRRRGCRRNSGC